jgi:hypothetical protein
MLDVLLITMGDMYGKTSESLEIAIATQLVANPRTADFENISLDQLRGFFQCFTENNTESSAIVKVDVGSVGVSDVNLQSDGVQMREQMNPTQLEALKTRSPLGELLKFRQKRMRQKLLRSGHARRAFQL